MIIIFWYSILTWHHSVDTRESNFSQGTHWSDDEYRDRLSFVLDGRTGTLTMRSTQQEDTGEYRCRVDFQKSPTRNSKVNLTVISKYALLKCILSKTNLVFHLLSITLSIINCVLKTKPMFSVYIVFLFHHKLLNTFKNYLWKGYFVLYLFVLCTLCCCICIEQICT